MDVVKKDLAKFLYLKVAARKPMLKFQMSEFTWTQHKFWKQPPLATLLTHNEAKTSFKKSNLKQDYVTFDKITS